MKKLYYILLVIWMVVIFSFSHKPIEQSAEMSGGITEFIVDTLEKNSSADMDKGKIEHYIRKCAHLTEYFILGALAFLAFEKNKFFKKNRILLCIVFCVLYAASDEIHQIFVPGRGPSAVDVLIDSIGSVTGILCVSCIKKLAISTNNKTVK